jgi:hypothetical protein
MSDRTNKYGPFSHLKENPLPANLILFFGLLLFVLFAIDVDTDLSLEQKEIDLVMVTLLPALNIPDLHLQTTTDFNIPCVGIIILSNEDLVYEFYSCRNFNRGPPSVS